MNDTQSFQVFQPEIILEISVSVCAHSGMYVWSSVIHTVKDITSDTWY